MKNWKSVSKWITGVKVLAGIGIIILLALISVRLITGRSLGIRSFLESNVHSLISLGKAVLDSQSITQLNRGDFTNVIFLHHSTGANLIEQGHVRQLFIQAGYDFFDHGYNHQGLRNPFGNPLGYSYNVPGDNTDPDGLAGIFDQRNYSVPLNTLSGLLQHEVIVFKSCFPVSHITANEYLEEYKSYYLGMRAVMDLHPDIIFIVMTPPPLNPAETDPQAASRARSFANWLKSEEFLQGHPNLFTFDFFDLLAESDTASLEVNMLRSDYRQGSDSHPNNLANQEIGPQFFEFIHYAVLEYRHKYEQFMLDKDI